MALTPQLPPTDYTALETVSDRADREALYEANAIVEYDEPQGKRYAKGTDPRATKRSWQSLDAVLRSDANAAAALPVRRMRMARLFTALTVASGILTLAGTAASAREGLDLKELNGTGGLLLGAGLATVAFGITAGIMYGNNRRQYQRAVDVYNDSLGMRLGLNTPQGDYIPPAGVLVDEDGFVVLDERERRVDAAKQGVSPTAAPANTVPVDSDATGVAPTDAAPTDARPPDAPPTDAVSTDAPPADAPPTDAPASATTPTDPDGSPSTAPADPPLRVPTPPGGTAAAPSLSLSPRR